MRELILANFLHYYLHPINKNTKMKLLQVNKHKNINQVTIVDVSLSILASIDTKATYT